jgi:hypothetical protein
MRWLDEKVNKVLSVFGKYPSGDRRVWFHSQNLNEDRAGNVKGWPYHGRCWMHLASQSKRSKTFRFSWNLWTHFCGVSLGTDSEEGGLSFFVGLPPVAFWVGVPVPAQKLLQNDFWARWNEKTGGYKGSHRYTSFRVFDVRVHDQTLHWSFLKFDWGWSRQMPKWMDGHFGLRDIKQALLGKEKYEEHVYQERDIVVTMPEGEYKGKAKQFDGVWFHERFDFIEKRVPRVSIELVEAIPFSGKGENSWDCGEDGTTGITCFARTIEEGIGQLVGSVLETRKKRGDPMKWPRPPRGGPPPKVDPSPNQGEASA